MPFRHTLPNKPSNSPNAMPFIATAAQPKCQYAAPAFETETVPNLPSVPIQMLPVRVLEPMIAGLFGQITRGIREQKAAT